MAPNLIFSTLILNIISIICNTSDLYYNEEKQASSSKITCANNEICNVFVSGKEAIQSSTIQCPSKKNCNIYCDEVRSCFRSIIHCPKSASCFIKCNGKYSCRYFTVNAPLRGNSLSIECNDYLSCADATILSLNNVGGTLYISALNGNTNYMMDGAQIECPKNGLCELNASGYQVMKDTLINASLSKTLRIKSSGKQSLMNSKIYCPNGEHECIVEVHGKKSRILYDTEIYAVESFKDLKLICDGQNCNKKIADGGIHAPVLFCNEDFDANCKLKLKNGVWYCGTRSQCQDWKGGKMKIDHEEL